MYNFCVARYQLTHGPLLGTSALNYSCPSGGIHNDKIHNKNGHRKVGRSENGALDTQKWKGGIQKRSFSQLRGVQEGSRTC